MADVLDRLETAKEARARRRQEIRELVKAERKELGKEAPRGEIKKAFLERMLAGTEEK